jgi:antitoxin component of MazEF toxin-antitoxin module
MKLVTYISLTHTPSTNIINIPIKMVKELGLENDKQVQVELNDDKIIITKVKE